jgi:hypothetical protein
MGLARAPINSTAWASAAVSVRSTLADARQERLLITGTLGTLVIAGSNTRRIASDKEPVSAPRWTD